MAAALACAVAFAASPVEWSNLDEPHHLAGRVASSGYLRGKVVLVDCRDYADSASAEVLRRMEDAWQTFKMKPFVLIGSHRGASGAERVAKIAKRLGITYPIYARADIASGGADDLEETWQGGYVYVVESTGKVVYRGPDEHRARGIIASALMSIKSPHTPQQWRRLIDFDLDVLPGRALNEIAEFRKAFPDEAQEYDSAWKQLSADEDVVRLAKLERLALQAKDYDFKDNRAKRLDIDKVKLAITAFSDLKTNNNQAVAQEAKNCIAELTWAVARLKGKQHTKKGDDK